MFAQKYFHTQSVHSNETLLYLLSNIAAYVETKIPKVALCLQTLCWRASRKQYDKLSRRVSK